MKALRYISAILAFLALAGCARNEPVKAVYLKLQDPVILQRYGGEMGALADELKSAGITLVISPVLEDGTAFYPSDILPQRWEYGMQLLAFRHELRRRHIDFTAAVSVFRDAYTYRTDPSLRAVNDYGTAFENGICPANKAYRDYKAAVIAEIMLILQPDALCLNDFYFPVETTAFCMTPARNSIRNTCFCSSCLSQFSDYAGITLQGNVSTADEAKQIDCNYAREWALWRSNLLTAYLENISTQIRRLNPQCRIMLNVIPLPEQNADSARRRIFGLDYKTLAPFVDTFVLNACSANAADGNAPLQRDIRELQTDGEKILALLEVRSYLRAGEEAFRSDLQYFRGNLLVSDWGQLLNNRRYLNIFKTEL